MALSNWSTSCHQSMTCISVYDYKCQNMSAFHVGWAGNISKSTKDLSMFIWLPNAVCRFSVLSMCGLGLLYFEHPNRGCYDKCIHKFFLVFCFYDQTPVDISLSSFKLSRIWGNVCDKSAWVLMYDRHLLILNIEDGGFFARDHVFCAMKMHF